MSKHSYGFYVSEWHANKSEILKLRHNVLVNELNAQHEITEHDEDPDCIHVIAYDGDSNAIGTGCISKLGVIRDVIVLNKWRGHTVGKAIVSYLLHIANVERLTFTTVKTPESLLSFYESYDFIKTDVSEKLNGIHYIKLVRELDVPKAKTH